MTRVAADLHIHSARSPCASSEMTPPAVVRAAREAGLDLIAICDHNSSANVAAVQQAAAGVLTALAGLEIATVEEVHVLALMPDADAAGAVAAELDVNPELLAAASTLTLSETVRLIHRYGGMAVAAHVDRPSFSVMSQLGLFPREAGFDAIELSVSGARARRDKEFTDLGLPILVGSDSHNLAEIGCCRMELEMEECSFAGLMEHLADPQAERVLYA